MNIDEYLNELQSNLDNQLARFGMGEQSAGNADNTEATEEKKFCPECGNKVAADATFCPECGYKFDAVNEAAEGRESAVDDNATDIIQESPEKTRIIEVRVWTGYLGTMYINPVCTDESRKAVHDANGEYNWELEERVQELSDCGYTQVHFANPDEDLQLHVVDGEETVYESDTLPVINAYQLASFAKTKADSGEVTEENWENWYDFDDEERNAAMAQFDKLLEAESQDGDYNADIVSAFWEQMRSGKIPSENAFMIGMIRSISDQLVCVDIEDDSEQSFLNSIGNVGKGIVTFRIEIPEGEDFDSSKLHFFSDFDWYDTNIHEAFYSGFVGMEDASLELLEYDGRIYFRDEAEYVPGWKDTGGTILVHADLTEFDPNELNFEVNDEENVANSSNGDNTNSADSSDSEELSQLYTNIDDAREAYLNKARERLKELCNIAAEKHEQDFGWMTGEVPDSDEDEEAYEEFEESKFHVIRYDDFAYQTGEIIGIRFRLDNSAIVITAYYDDEDDEIVEDCELYFNYGFADNYNAVAFCIEVAERELGLK